MKYNRLSPLRYPGGKAKLYPKISELLDKYKLDKFHYYEPYAGGAGIALALLFNGRAHHITINDADYAIYSFWHSVTHDTDKLINLILNTPVTIKEWNVQKNIQNNKLNYSTLEVGFSTFFLNRTNHSGILKAGYLGGKSQEKNKIDCRYNKET